MVTARNTVDWSNHYLSWDYWSSVLSMSLIKKEEEEEANDAVMCSCQANTRRTENKALFSFATVNIHIIYEDKIGRDKLNVRVCGVSPICNSKVIN